MRPCGEPARRSGILNLPPMRHGELDGARERDDVTRRGLHPLGPLGVVRDLDFVPALAMAAKTGNEVPALRAGDKALEKVARLYMRLELAFEL